MSGDINLIAQEGSPSSGARPRQAPLLDGESGGEGLFTQVFGEHLEGLIQAPESTTAPANPESGEEDPTIALALIPQPAETEATPLAVDGNGSPLPPGGEPLPPNRPNPSAVDPISPDASIDLAADQGTAPDSPSTISGATPLNSTSAPNVGPKAAKAETTEPGAQAPEPLRVIRSPEPPQALKDTVQSQELVVEVGRALEPGRPPHAVDNSQPPRFLEARSRGLPVNQAPLNSAGEGMPLNQTAELEAPMRVSEMVPPRSAILDGPSSGQDYRLALGPNAGLDALQMDGALDPPGSQGEVRGPTSGPRANLSLTLDVPVNSPNWGASLANRVAWLINNNSQSAEIRLDPPQLGPLDVHISIDGEEAQIKFAAESGVTREILENELPRLRDFMGASGFSKVDVTVSDERSARGEFAGAQGDAAGAQDDSQTQESEISLVQTITTSGIDYFA